jgi:hypothetical protein
LSLPESPVKTEAQQILDGQAEIMERLDRHADAINSVGANLEWIVENVKGIFQMFGNPAFMSQMGAMMAQGGVANVGRPENGTDSGTESGS